MEPEVCGAEVMKELVVVAKTERIPKEKKTGSRADYEAKRESKIVN